MKSLTNSQKIIHSRYCNTVSAKFSPSGIRQFLSILKPGCRIYYLLFILTFFMLSCTDNNKSGIELSDLKCDYRENPLGIDNETPKLSWLLHAEERDQKQTAYHILVASSLENLDNNTGDVWDSHKVKSEQSVQIPYNGIKLESGKRYYWKVQVWDKRNKKSNWSKPAYWEMGLLRKEDWKASWIAYESTTAPFFRKEFDINGSLKDARVYISGLGFYELSINGSKIGDHVLDPGQTDYEQRTFYVVYDVTESIRQGANVIGIMLGNGWYNQTGVNHGRYGWTDMAYGHPLLIFQMKLTFADGSQKLIVSDETWKASTGPILSDNIYAGEVYDSRLEQEGWDKAGFDDSEWKPVRKTEGPGGKLVSQNLPPIKKIQNISPVRIMNPKPGVYIYDMGQNFAGWCRLKIKAPEGTEIQLRFAEWIGKDGMIDPGSTGIYATGVVQTDQYTCKGKGIEIWEPRFTYHGFQFVEMMGFPGKPTTDNLEGIVVHTSLQKSGEFECSDSMLNKLHKTAIWTEVSNMHSIPTDCPHRERCGWLGDAFLTSDMVNYNFDAALFWSKFIEDIETSRRGDVPTDIAPGRRWAGRNPDWGAAFVQLPWNLYLYYADETAINDHYEGMKFFMDSLQKMADNNIIYKGIGSLFSPGRIKPLDTPREFTTTVLFHFCAGVMSHMARIAHKADDAEKYSLLRNEIKSSFNAKFYDKKEKTYGNQEKNTLALAFGLVPDGDDHAVAENINLDVLEVHDGHVSTGVFGTRYIYDVLGKYAYEKTLQKVLHSDEFPSYGYLFSRGATTFWENWGELKFADREAPGDDRSKSHPFRGGFDAWFYNGIAGINPDPEKPGFKHIIFQPQLIRSLEHVSAVYHSVHGAIASRWNTTPDEFKWSLSVPVNTSATVYLPTDRKELISEGNISPDRAKAVSYLRTENGYCIYNIGSGNYSFTIRNEK